MVDINLQRRLQELINIYGWDQVMSNMPTKKVLNKDYKRQEDKRRDEEGIGATPVVKPKPPSDSAPSIASSDASNTDKINKKKEEILVPA